MAQSTGLTVRLHERERISLPVQFTVAEEHRTQVRFATTSNVTNRQTITGIAIDLSRGGLGIECGQFLPRLCEGKIRIFDASFSDATPEALLQIEPAIEFRVKVRRTILADHEPTYTIGLAFVNPTDDLRTKVDVLCESFIASDQEGGDE
ncbi:MAG: PilZ domain-containing protein [Planctomycetota bacterium]|nr:PilZ domain-containing protein [Planctomycetota bacterium]